MSELLGFTAQLPVDDVDATFNSNVASEIVKAVIEEEAPSGPKPVTKTSSFYTLVGSLLASIAVVWLVNKGVLTKDTAGAATEQLSGLFTGIVFLGAAYVAGKFVEARGKVSEAKVLAATQLQLAAMRD
jgi:hypothetical protein